MKPYISASGYINVVLILDMKRFVHDDDQIVFESLRGTEELAKIIKHEWQEKCLEGPFVSTNDERNKKHPDDNMSAEEIGFATGVFRSSYINDHTFPTYRVNKERFEFAKPLRENYQFDNIFWRSWKKWDIYIRPTSLGFFVIRLTYKFPKPLATEKIASNVIELQESLDVKSAQNWLNELPSKYKDQPNILQNKENSIHSLLDWLGVENDNQHEIKYVPVQWKIAMEISKRFIQEIGYQIPLKDTPIRLLDPKPNMSNPLYESFVIYHLDELLATRNIVPRFNNNRNQINSNPKDESDHSSNTQVSVLIDDIHNSNEISGHLVNLIEGSVLHKQDKLSKTSKELNSRKIFPILDIEYVDNAINNDKASWINELCLLSSRSALFMPARNLRTDELLISTLPSATSRVRYIRYWGSIERMIEFMLEVHVMAQLIEGTSYKLLADFSKDMQEAREGLFKGDIKLNNAIFRSLVSDASNLRRLASLCRNLGNPASWSRAEYAISKASYLFEKLGLPFLLNQIDRNINSINSTVDHLDELYLADLAEDNNNISFVLTLGLAAVSLLLTILIIPSFWADLTPAKENAPLFILGLIKNFGNILLCISIITALGLGFIVFNQGRRIWSIIIKFLFRKPK